MIREHQLTGTADLAYARPFVPVGAVAGFDENVFEVVTAGDEGREPRGL